MECDLRGDPEVPEGGLPQDGCDPEVSFSSCSYLVSIANKITNIKGTFQVLHKHVLKC